jgi:hypothetical protein
MVLAITVGVLPEDGPPQVGVTVTGTSGGLVDVETSWDDGATWRGLRGGGGLSTTGGSAFLRDHVPALNHPTRWRVVDGDDVAATGEVVVPSATAWLQDPLIPRSGVPVSHVRSGDSILLLSDSVTSVQRSQMVDLVMPHGGTLPVASIGLRRGMAGALMHLRASLESQGVLVASLRDLFARAGQVVIRGLPEGLLLDPVAHVVAPDLTESPVQAGSVGFFCEWEFTATQVRPTDLRIVVPWWTYQQVTDLWQSTADNTYGEVLLARPGDTYLDWSADPTEP